MCTFVVGFKFGTLLISLMCCLLFISLFVVVDLLECTLWDVAVSCFTCVLLFGLIGFGLMFVMFGWLWWFAVGVDCLLNLSISLLFGCLLGWLISCYFRVFAFYCSLIVLMSAF